MLQCKVANEIYKYNRYLIIIIIIGNISFAYGGPFSEVQYGSSEYILLQDVINFNAKSILNRHDHDYAKYKFAKFKNFTRYEIALILQSIVFETNFKHNNTSSILIEKYKDELELLGVVISNYPLVGYKYININNKFYNCIEIISLSDLIKNSTYKMNQYLTIINSTLNEYRPIYASCRFYLEYSCDLYFDNYIENIYTTKYYKSNKIILTLNVYRMLYLYSNRNKYKLNDFEIYKMTKI